MSERVLFVDDEINVLKALKRQLRKADFRVDVAESGAEGLAMIQENGPYAVVVSDMRMPEMDGVQFLSAVKEIAPETVRMMLTGNADQETAIHAVNEGNIFRFLNKPCLPDVLKSSVDAAIKQYHLVIAEKELLNKTLKGSIKVMAEILGQVNPTVFSRSARIKRHVTQVALRLGLPSLWEFSVAGFLSQIGCVTVPNDILERFYAGERLEPEEEKIFNSHPAAGAALLVNIPRLENISRMIALQMAPFSSYRERPISPEDKLVYIGGQILKAAVDFDHLVFLGNSPADVIKKMKESDGEYNRKILDALAAVDTDTSGFTVKKLKLGQIIVGMKLNQDLKAKNGLLLAVKGQEITLGLRERLINFAKTIGIDEPFEVMVRA